MDVSITSVTSPGPSPALARLDSADSTVAASRSSAAVSPTSSTAATSTTPTSAESDALDTARMNAVVDLIASLTGRQVKLVPPTAYLVSAPGGREATPPVELLAPLGLASQLKEEPGTLEVDVTSVLRTGTAERMLLDQKTVGQLQLRAAVDVVL